MLYDFNYQKDLESVLPLTMTCITIKAHDVGSLFTQEDKICYVIREAFRILLPML